MIHPQIYMQEKLAQNYKYSVLYVAGRYDSSFMTHNCCWGLSPPLSLSLSMSVSLSPLDHLGIIYNHLLIIWDHLGVIWDHLVVILVDSDSQSKFLIESVIFSHIQS